MSGVVRRRNSPDSGDSPAWIAPWDLPTRLGVTRRRPSIRPCTNFLHSHDMPPVTPPSENSLFHPLWRSREPRNFIYIVSPLGTHFRCSIIGLIAQLSPADTAAKGEIHRGHHGTRSPVTRSAFAMPWQSSGTRSWASC